MFRRTRGGARLRAACIKERAVADASTWTPRPKNVEGLHPRHGTNVKMVFWGQAWGPSASEKKERGPKPRERENNMKLRLWAPAWGQSALRKAGGDMCHESAREKTNKQKNKMSNLEPGTSMGPVSQPQARSGVTRGTPGTA
eukprot:9137538-Pyramimonas_sp.AAC.1